MHKGSHGSVGGQFGQIHDVIRMRVREEDQAEVEAVLLDEVDHRPSIGSGVKSDRILRFGVPHEVGIHRHVVIGRVELRQALQRDRRRPPVAVRHRDESQTIKLKVWRDLAEQLVIHRAGFCGGNIFDADASLGGEISIAEAKSAHGLGDDIIEKVFERNRHGRRFNAIWLRWQDIMCRCAETCLSRCDRSRQSAAVCRWRGCGRLRCRRRGRGR